MSADRPLGVITTLGLVASLACAPESQSGRNIPAPSRAEKTATAQPKNLSPEATPYRVVPIDPEKQRKGQLLESLTRRQFKGELLSRGSSFSFNNVVIRNNSSGHNVLVDPTALSRLLDLCQTNSLPGEFKIYFVDSLPNGSVADIAPGIGSGSVSISVPGYNAASRKMLNDYAVTPGTEPAAARVLSSMWMNIRIVDGACAAVYMTEMASASPTGELTTSQINQALMQSSTFSASLERPLLAQQYQLGIVYGSAPITAPTPTN